MIKYSQCILRNLVNYINKLKNIDMIVTKEHQEAMVENYKKRGKTPDEVCAYIDGISDMLTFVCEKSIKKLQGK